MSLNKIILALFVVLAAFWPYAAHAQDYSCQFLLCDAGGYYDSVDYVFYGYARAWGVWGDAVYVEAYYKKASEWDWEFAGSYGNWSYAEVDFAVIPGRQGNYQAKVDAYFGLWRDWYDGSATSAPIAVSFLPTSEISEYNSQVGFGAEFGATLQPYWLDFSGGWVEEQLSGWSDGCNAYYPQGPTYPVSPMAGFTMSGSSYVETISMPNDWVLFYGLLVHDGLIPACGWSVDQTWTYDSYQYASRSVGQDLTGPTVVTRRDAVVETPSPYPW